MKRTMLQKFGILGLISLLAYPGYNWLPQRSQ